MGHVGSGGERAGAPSAVCPGNGRPAAPVLLRTVKAMLVPAALRRVGRDQHYYCTDANCSVVYFTGAGAQYAVGDVSVPVADKHGGPPRLVCYCFGYVEEHHVTTSGEPEPETIAAIRAHVHAGRCACDVKNPSGRCCLRSLTPG